MRNRQCSKNYPCLLQDVYALLGIPMDFFVLHVTETEHSLEQILSALARLLDNGPQVSKTIPMRPPLSHCLSSTSVDAFMQTRRAWLET